MVKLANNVAIGLQASKVNLPIKGRGSTNFKEWSHGNNITMDTIMYMQRGVTNSMHSVVLYSSYNIVQSNLISSYYATLSSSLSCIMLH
jgi:hypothetical protein